MAPEILSGEPYDGLAGDVYSLGIILMDLVIGPQNDVRLPTGKGDQVNEAYKHNYILEEKEK